MKAGRTCPGCGRIMSAREAIEQGACNDCRPEGMFGGYKLYITGADEPVAAGYLDDDGRWHQYVGHADGLNDFFKGDDKPKDGDEKPKEPK